MALPTNPTHGLEVLPELFKTSLGLQPNDFIRELKHDESGRYRASLYHSPEITPFVRIEETEDAAGNVTARAIDAASLVVETKNSERLLSDFPEAEWIGDDMYVLKFGTQPERYADYLHTDDPVARFKRYADSVHLEYSLVEENGFIVLPEPRSTPPRETQWTVEFVHLPGAHARTRGKGVIVAVLDSGLSPHPELMFATILPGINVFTGSSDVTDTTGHGTSCAGTIVAQRNTKLLGMAPDCSLLPVKVMGGGWISVSTAAAKGIYSARERGARIMSLSFSVTEEKEHLKRAMEAHPDVLFVVAAGDRTVEITDGFPIFPASFGLSNVLSVIGCTERGERARCSTFDRTGSKAHIAAPGEEVECCVLGNGSPTLGLCGTSFAAPQMAGICALVWSLRPKATVDEIKERVIAKVSRTRGLAQTCRAEGHVNADAACKKD